MSDKPDDVSQEAWDAALGVGIYYSKPDPWMDRTLIARAIDAAVMAEREACAVVADDLTPRKWAATLAAHATGLGIARAIRARSRT